MNVRLKSIGLFAALSIAALAGACGPATPAVQSAEDDKARRTESKDTTDATNGTPTGAPDSSTAPSSTPAAKPPPAPGPAAGAGMPATSIPLAQSKVLEDLKKIGINLAKIPELEKLPLAQKKKVMPLMQKALGYASCTSCHVEGDFKTDTRNMKISREMWRAYSVAMRDEKGGALFCDSCHSGQAKVLNRSDKEALKEFMENEYEHKLTRADKKENECSTCHGDTMEMKIIEVLWKIPPEAKK